MTAGMQSLTRRGFVAGSLAAAGCTRAPGTAAAVSIVKCAAYGQEIYATVRRTLAEHKLNVRGKRVVLKPNLVEFEPGSSINTHPMVVHAALEAFRAMGAADVRIAEGPGHRRNTFDLADSAGYFDVIPGFEDLFTDLNLDDVTEVKLASPRAKIKSLYLPNTALGADLLVSMAKLKTHHWAGATLSMKNFFGLVPGGVYGWPKNVLHWSGIDESINDLHAALPRAFALVDGIVGMQGNGPIQGTPKNAGVLISGRSLPAVDATCCRIMKIVPERVHFLQLADIPARIEQRGEAIGEVATAFDLLPQHQSLRA